MVKTSINTKYHYKFNNVLQFYNSPKFPVKMNSWSSCMLSVCGVKAHTASSHSKWRFRQKLELPLASHKANLSFLENCANEYDSVENQFD